MAGTDTHGFVDGEWVRVVSPKVIDEEFRGRLGRVLRLHDGLYDVEFAPGAWEDDDPDGEGWSFFLPQDLKRETPTPEEMRAWLEQVLAR